MEPAILAVLAIPLQTETASVPRLGGARAGKVLLRALVLQHPADLVARLEEGRMTTRTSKVGVEVLMLADEAVHQVEEDIGELRIELRAASAANLRERPIDRPRGREGPAVGEGVEDVGKRDDASVNRDAIAREPGWVTFAVPPFVVMLGHLRCDSDKPV